MKKNLIVVRAGDNSLHPEWLGPNQNFDVVVSYFGNQPDIYRTGVTRIDHKGSKWEGLTLVMNSPELNGEILNWKDYDYICFPDDDLRTGVDTWNEFFDIVHELKPALSQPALTPESYFTHPITLQVPDVKYRKTNFVEVMAPCFRRDFFYAAKHTFAENASGWGLDYLWPSMIDDRDNIIIVDKTPIVHTRPVGSAGHGGGTKNPKHELKHLMKKYNIQRSKHVAASYDFNNRVIEK